ncbi:intracellular septation protein A [Orbus hercynius]|uniref:Inner membrane-spanning protein YciB n=1 Tax=Orbus hercynius TaxID=593135 RepID=A0A495RHU1_9GAMM|nr:septation protein A [Orbus hercynius]RKS87062.1 intracellular septation protein A [Orbus hercynius]
MKQLLNFIPLVFFFVFLMMYDIFAGVKALIISSTIVFIIIWLTYKKIEKIELFSYLMVLVFGALTLYLHNENFIKWKVTLINFLFAIILLISQIGFKKNLIQKLMGKEIQLPLSVWNKLNILWAIFFILCGLISLYVTYHMSTEFFGIFKAFILPGASLLLALVSGIYIYSHMDKNNDK